jgi:hypothetical protein
MSSQSCGKEKEFSEEDLTQVSFMALILYRPELEKI